MVRALDVGASCASASAASLHGDLEAHTTVTFAEQGGKTTLSVHQVYSYESDATRGAQAGWTQTLAQLAQHLGRSFDASSLRHAQRDNHT